MTAETAIIPRMTSDEFLVWAARQPGDAKYELHEGVVVEMARELWLHGIVKMNVTLAFNAAKPPCREYVDGVFLTSVLPNGVELAR